MRPEFNYGNWGAGFDVYLYIDCNLNIYENLIAISKYYNKNFKSLNKSEKFYEEMLNLTIEKVFEEGLHEFLVRYLKNLFILATIIETDFRFYK